MDLQHNPSLQAVLLELEEDRKNLRITMVKTIVIACLGLVALAISFLGLLGGPVGYIIGGIILIVALVIAAKRANAFAAYNQSFKQRVIGAALAEIDPCLTIKPENGLSEREFISAQLFNTNPDRYSSEDEVSGMAGKTSFYFSEVHAEYKTESEDKDGNTQTEWHDIFRGIIFTADFNKNFKGITKIRPKQLGNRIGAWITKAVPLFASEKNQLVELENEVFSETFITHSSDQVEARYLLTPAMMEKLAALNQKSSSTISLTFIKSKVYIVFPLNRDYFEAPIFKSLLAPDCLDEDLHIIRFMYAIIAELDLNTRIWGKD